MRDKLKAKNYNALYRKQHYIAIAIKNQIYKNLPHIKERRRQQNRLRKDYFKKYYEQHKEYFRQKSAQWVKEHPERRKHVLQRYTDKLRLRQKRKHAKSRIERIINDFLQYCKDRYDNDTLRHYAMNMARFHNYIKQHNTRCKEYHSRYYSEPVKICFISFCWPSVILISYEPLMYMAVSLEESFLILFPSELRYIS